MTESDTPAEDDGQVAAAEESVSSEPEAERSDEAPAETAGAERARPVRRARGAYFMSALALLCAFATAAAAGYLWWQHQQFSLTVERSDSDTAALLQAVRLGVQGLEDEVANLETGNDVTRALTSDLSIRVDSLPGRLLDLEERLDATQGVSGDTRRSWLRAEAEYYLEIGNAELSLAGRWESAIRALEFADEKLQELGDPALSRVRDEIATELTALRAVRVPDVEGLSFSLARLAESSRTMPMRAALSGSFVTGDGTPAEAPSGLARIWASLRSAIAGMVSVERQENPVARALSADDQVLLRQRLELELGLARHGLILGQADVFRQSLASARDLLQQFFDAEQAPVESAMARVEEMLVLEIAPERPDISGSLTLLRSLPDRDN